jgi:acyl carrier protein
MKKYEIEQSLIEIVSKICRCDKSEITVDKTRDEIRNWDSFAHINIIMLSEAELGIIVPIEEIANIKSIKDIVRYAKN